MSNPGVFCLSNSSINGTNIKWEDNLGEAIHLHLGITRLTLSTKEFLDFSQAVLEALNQVISLPENYTMSDFDPYFIYEFAPCWAKITDITKEDVVVSDLKALYEPKTILELNQSPFFCYFNGHREWALSFCMNRPINVSKEEHIEGIRKIVDDKGYPFRNQFIIIDEHNRILDGEIRAAYLMYKYGSKYSIPVLRFHFDANYTRGREKEIVKW